MTELLDQTFVFMAVAIIVAGLVRGFTGFGSAMVMAPVLVYFLGPAQAVATNIMLEFLVSLQLVPAARKHLDIRLLAPLGIGAFAGAPFGVWLAVVVDPEIMRRAVSIIILSFVIILAWGWRYKGAVKAWISTLIGCTGGILSGSTSMGGPPVIIYLMSGPNKPERVRSTIILYFVLSIIPTLGGLVWAGIIDKDLLLRVALLAPLFLASAWFGSRFFHIAPESFFRRLTLGLLAIIASSSFFV
jgi:hypothetical protein